MWCNMTCSKNLAIENLSHTLDLRGLRCPLPAIKALKYLKSDIAITSLNILVTDRSAVEDVPLALSGLGWASPIVEKLDNSVLPTWRLYFAARN
jgi:TusA-related sulfurtransferase